MYLSAVLLSCFMVAYSVADDDGVIFSHHLNVPAYAQYGSTVEMTCEYSTSIDVYHSFAWHKDGELLYGYDKNNSKAEFVDLPGIHIDHTKTDNHTLVLQNVTEEATGRYDCQMDSWHENLHGVKLSGNLTVLPQNEPINCDEGSELLWETLRQYYPDVIKSLPYVPDKLNCVNGTAP